MALLDDSDAAAVFFDACDVDCDGLRAELVAYIDRDLASLIVTHEGEDAKPTAGFQRVLQRAVIHVQSAGRDEVTGAHILVSLFSERESHAVFFLQGRNLTRLDVVSFLAHGLTKGDQDDLFEELQEEDGDERVVKKTKALESYCANLNSRARGTDRSLDRRVDEVDRTIQVLCRRQKNNPLYVGEPKANGAGRGLGAADRAGRSADALRDAVIFRSTWGRCLRAIRYRGDFEERLKNVLKELQAIPHAILFIDEIHTVIGAGFRLRARWMRRIC